MKRHAESHLDHGLSDKQLEYIFDLFKNQREFFKTTIELPVELGTVPCGLWGPAMDDEPIGDDHQFSIGRPMPPGDYLFSGALARFGMADRAAAEYLAQLKLPTFTGEITHGKRGARGWESRLINAPMRPTRKVFIVAGPHEGHPCIVYTMYGGPEAPQEPTDPKLPDNKRDASLDFWAVHALSRYST